MDLKLLATVFAAVFVAELGDKTQLATLLFAADPERSKWIVFFAASAALVFASGIAVVAGEFISRYAPERYLRFVAGVGFIAIGLWTLMRG